MGFYPRYSIEECLDLEGKKFFVFLEEGFRLESVKVLRDMGVARSANADQDEYSIAKRHIERSARDPLEYLEENSDYSGLEKVKEKFSGK